jgi:hypothetical protein
MESTGVYWKPIYNLLELEDIQPMVVNAAHIKAVPGGIPPVPWLSYVGGVKAKRASGMSQSFLFFLP